MPRSPVVALKVLKFIEVWKEENDGNSPTYEQIGESFDCTPQVAWEHVCRLERYGLIKIDKSRRITLINKDRTNGTYIPPSR